MHLYLNIHPPHFFPSLSNIQTMSHLPRHYFFDFSVSFNREITVSVLLLSQQAQQCDFFSINNCLFPLPLVTYGNTGNSGYLWGRNLLPGTYWHVCSHPYNQVTQGTGCWMDSSKPATWQPSNMKWQGLKMDENKEMMRRMGNWGREASAWRHTIVLPQVCLGIDTVSLSTMLWFLLILAQVMDYLEE